ncbi:MAG: DUF58 domain-containing protein, partial [Chloroflexota bacterium]|nr:DUF58 domain-containing protein [Chloroflexota bacterium]
GSGLYLHLAYFLLITLVLSGLWAWVGLLWLQVKVERRAGHTQVGQSVEETITVENRGRLTKGWLEVQDQANLPGGFSPTALTLPAGRSQSWVSRAECRQRGLFSLGPVDVASEDPFGLFRLRRSFGPTGKLLVYPATVDLPQFSVPSVDLSEEGPQHHHAPRAIINAYTTRDYMPGDSLNRVHWRSTARWGKLMVKEFEQESSSQVWLLLDMDERVHTGEGPEGTEEYGVTIAASLAKKLLEARFAVGLAAQGDQSYIIPPERGSGQLARVMEALAVVRARGHVSVAELLASTVSRLGRGGAAVLITSSSEESLAEGLSHLGQRRMGLAAIFLDSASFGEQKGPQPLAARMKAIGIPAFQVRQGDDLALALSAVPIQGVR